MSTVAILGAGEIGGAIAHALAAHDRVRRVLLIDTAGTSAEGKALDIRQTGAVEGFHTAVDGTAEPLRVAGCDVCVIADRFERGKGEWQGEDGLALLRELAPLTGDAPLLFAGPSQALLIETAARELSIPVRRLIGSAPEALVAAVTAIVAMEARCSPGEVQLTVVGSPPAGFIVPWTEASIGGYAIEHVLSQAQLATVQARTARLWPPGPYALGAAAARATEAILHSSRRSFSLLTVLRGELGVRNRVGALPCTVGPAGVTSVRVPSLSPRERVQLETALAIGDY
jgi:malate dehydrogenase